MNRPYMRLTGEELVEQFEVAGEDLGLLKALKEEADHRIANRAPRVKPPPGMTRLMVLSARASLKLEGKLPADGLPLLDATPEIPSFLLKKAAPAQIPAYGAPSTRAVSTESGQLFPSSPPVATPVQREPARVPAGEKASAALAKQPGPPPVSADAAYRILNVPPTAGWVTIEGARRTLVEQSSPTSIAKLPAPRRASALEAARRVNEAYLSLLRWRET